MSLLLGRKRKKKIVVFLCTGNTCRGPMAQGYMKKAMEDRGIKNVEVRTAGVMTIPGLIPTAEAAQVMKAADVDVSGHRSSPLTHELIRKADLILGMTPFHVQYALRMSDDAKGKTYLLKEYAESDVKNYQITDPMGATLEVYKRVYREMKLAIDKMLDNKDFFVEESNVEPPKKKSAGKASSTKKSPAAKAKKKSGDSSKSTKSASPKSSPKSKSTTASKSKASSSKTSQATKKAVPAKGKSNGTPKKKAASKKKETASSK